MLTLSLQARNVLPIACNLNASFGPNSRQTRNRQHDRKCRLKSIYFDHPSQGTSTNYYLILGPRDKVAPPTSQQINKFPPKRVNNLATPSSIFFFFFFFFFVHPQESSALNQSEAMIVQYGECSQNMLSEVKGTCPPSDSEYSFDEYFQLGSRRKVPPIKSKSLRFLSMQNDHRND